MNRARTSVPARAAAPAWDPVAILREYEQCVMPTYSRVPVVFVRGQGVSLWDVTGREYLDFFPGWGVSALGHCHPAVVAAIQEQAAELLHVPNTYLHPYAGRLARELTRLAFDGKVFFANSGAEANEAAIKLARRYGRGQRTEMITTERSFHGRTLATLSATGQARIQQGFAPLLPGFRTVPFNDLEAVRRAVTPQTVGVLIEPIQGEGGIRVAEAAYLRGLRALCTERDLLLIFDEVQTGMGRTGDLFAYQHDGVVPDIMTLAKSLGGGFPIGATVAARPIADTLGPGSHASTFAGSPLACRAALAVCETLVSLRLPERVREMSGWCFEELRRLARRHPVIREVRGRGFMVGIELDQPGQPVVEACRDRGVLINCTQERVLRLMPSLLATKAEWTRALETVEAALTGVGAG